MGAAAAAAPALLHCIASSFSVGERSWLTSCLSATAPSVPSEERAVGPCEARDVIFDPHSDPPLEGSETSEARSLGRRAKQAGVG